MSSVSSKRIHWNRSHKKLEPMTSIKALYQRVLSRLGCRRVTAFLGAGAVVDIGGPTTGALTKFVRAVRQEHLCPPNNWVKGIPFLDCVAARLDQYLHPAKGNFEDLFHALETLSSLQRGWQPKTVKQFRPHACAFTRPSMPACFQDDNLLITAKRDLLWAVGDQVDGYASSFDPQGPHRWFAEFWRQALERSAWDIATLNYDDCVERSVVEFEPEDGFEDVGQPFKRFKPKKLLGKARARILHLHGHFKYGYPRWPNPNAHLFEDFHEDLYKYQDYASAKGTWTGRSTNQAQAGEEAIAGPLVTGLRKTDKLLCYPYSSYYSVLNHALIRSPRLLIIGYSWGDYHFNRMLQRMTGLHDKDRRVVIIDFFPHREDHWHPDPGVMDWPGASAYRALATLFRGEPFETSGFKLRSPLVSSDGCARLYLKGTKDAFENHADEILRFLTA
jgi:hypothetical protein